MILRTFLIVFILLPGFVSPAFSAEELTWHESLQEAADNHPDLIVAQEGIVQRQADKAIALSGGLPQVDASAGASVSESDGSGSSNSFNYGVSASQNLFNGFQTVNDVKGAAENVQAAQENFKFTSADVRFRLRQAFINLLKAQKSVDLKKEIYDIRKNNFDLITLRYQSGTEHKGAFLTAQANVSQAEFEIHQAERELETSQRELIKELGRQQFAPIVVNGELVVADAALQKPDFETIAQKNPFLLQVVAEKNAAMFNVRTNKGKGLPEVSLDGGIGRNGSKWPPNDDEASAGVTVSVPIFEGGARNARVKQAQSVYRQKEQEERSTKDEVVLTLQQQWSGLQDAVENVNVQSNFLEATEERAKIAEQQYSVGLISFDNWIIIEDDLVRNKKSFLDTQANALIAEAQWVQAKGETLEYEN